ncbi:MAG: hypothetical protein U1C57_01940 [Candidatus Doudnabacteria bacterium]|nr:hypothetical protein [Desulfobacterales bacterium]MDZ4243845.1 hypothetical protein [Candidatus Doudnabacteria bacterium]
MAEENKGQTDGTPTVAAETSTTGQTPIIPAGERNIVDIVLKAAAEQEATAASKTEAKPQVKAEAKTEEKAEDKGKEKPPPYDKDPKWLKARAAEKSLHEILETAGLDSPEALKEEVAKGRSLQEILGTRDAQQLIKDADYLQEVKDYWANQERIKQEENEDPEETIVRLKQERFDFEKSLTAEKTKEEEAKAAKKALSDFTNTVESEIKAAGLEGDALSIAKLLSGVDNPFNVVDITDKAAAKEMAKGNAATLKAFLDKHAQAAVDKYASGKSNIVPITAANAPANQKVERARPSKALTPDETFGFILDQMLESVNSQKSA